MQYTHKKERKKEKKENNTVNVFFFWAKFHFFFLPEEYDFNTFKGFLWTKLSTLKWTTCKIHVTIMQIHMKTIT